MPDLATQIRERLNPPTLIVDFGASTWTPEQIEEFRHRLREACGRRSEIRVLPIDPQPDYATSEQLRAALLAVLDATDPAQLPPNGCGGDGCLALWVRHRIAVTLGIEADHG